MCTCLTGFISSPAVCTKVPSVYGRHCRFQCEYSETNFGDSSYFLVGGLTLTISQHKQQKAFVTEKPFQWRQVVLFFGSFYNSSLSFARRHRRTIAINCKEIETKENGGSFMWTSEEEKKSNFVKMVARSQEVTIFRFHASVYLILILSLLFVGFLVQKTFCADLVVDQVERTSS